MALSLYNTSTGKKEEFIPLDEQHITMYVCGPTVYNRVHIGNARPAVIFDVLARLLRTLYPRVSYARNITDIDDKIMTVAKENAESITTVADRYTDAYVEDMAALQNLPPDIAPKATQHIDDMLHLVQTLLDQGHAYEAESHVLFDVRSMPAYGKLSNRSLDDMLAGARVEVAGYKKYAGDFVLWKPSLGDEPGWDSPWGRGRPGWHLECSAMISHHLGETIDIHGGGRDLIFPHHENEIAQSSCAHSGAPLARYWLHNGYINIDGEKMSKSLGNFRLVNDLLKHYSGEVLRFAILTAQYRSELNFSTNELDAAQSALDTLYGSLRDAVVDKQSVADGEIDLTQATVYQALLDDLNTPLAISRLHGLAKAMRKAEPGSDQQAQLYREIRTSASIMGVLQDDPEQWFKRGGDGLSEDEVNAKIAARDQAREDKNFPLADQLRDELVANGIVLEDSSQGTRWKRE